jgi:hypothetical protein
MSKLLYVGQQIANELKSGIDGNISRYWEGDFLDLEASGDWRIPLSVDVDLSGLSELSAESGAEHEIRNSLLVGHALNGLTPTLARENRIWIRLSHVDCLEYSRQRWLQANMGDEALISAISKHFFAPTLTGCRDDHAISRLWWNHRIAKQIMPDNPARALKVILARADIRLNFLERPGLAARQTLAKGIVRALEESPELLNGEKLFRRFMKQVNLQGAGIAFEVWADNKIDQLMMRCLENVRGQPGQDPDSEGT